MYLETVLYCLTSTFVFASIDVILTLILFGTLEANRMEKGIYHRDFGIALLKLYIAVAMAIIALILNSISIYFIIKHFHYD